MARQRLPKRLDQKSALKLMEKNGWTNSKGGKHVVKMTKPGHRPVTLPMHRGEDLRREPDPVDFQERRSRMKSYPIRRFAWS